MLDHVIKEVMPTDTRSKMGSRMITMLHQFLDGSISRLPANWQDAKRKLTAVAEVPRLTKWDPPEQIEYIGPTKKGLDNLRKHFMDPQYFEVSEMPTHIEQFIAQKHNITPIHNPVPEIDHFHSGRENSD